ncbi:MAG: hypothetical protein WBD22_02770 [Pyrinomonadaceae bacterium]
MLIAKIVSSNSHVDYVGRVVDDLDSNSPPLATDYGFAQFVRLPQPPVEVIGVIYDSRLVNPEYGNYGPRLSPKPDLGSFSPDYLNEQGVLLGILLIGTLSEDGSVHGVPRGVVPPGQEVKKLEPEGVNAFHLDAEGSLHIHYYPEIVTHAGPFAVPLLEAVIHQLSPFSSAADMLRLEVLGQGLKWQRAFAGMRL